MVSQSNYSAGLRTRCALVLFASCLGISSISRAEDTNGCSRIYDKKSSTQKVLNGVQAYCAFRAEAAKSDFKNGMDKALLATAGFVGAKLLARADDVLEAREKLAATLHWESRRNGYDQATREHFLALSHKNKIPRGSRIVTSFGMLGSFALGVYHLYLAAVMFEGSNPGRSLTNIFDSVIESFVPNVADGTLGPMYVQSQENLQRFFELPEGEALQIISGSPTAEQFFYSSWKMYKLGQGRDGATDRSADGALANQ